MSKHFGVFFDKQKRTCLRVGVSGNMTKYIPINLEGFRVCETPSLHFNLNHKEMSDYPIERGFQLFLNYCLVCGATKEALDYIGQVVEVSKEDRRSIQAIFNKDK